MCYMEVTLVVAVGAGGTRDGQPLLSSLNEDKTLVPK